MNGIVDTLRKAIVWGKQSGEFTQYEYDQYRYAHRDRRIQEDMQEQEDGESFMAEMTFRKKFRTLVYILLV
jgi:hypothetical protein